MHIIVWFRICCFMERSKEKSQREKIGLKPKKKQLHLIQIEPNRIQTNSSNLIISIKITSLLCVFCLISVHLISIVSIFIQEFISCFIYIESTGCINLSKPMNLNIIEMKTWVFVAVAVVVVSVTVAARK